jgi:hypothetical protein
MKTAPRRALVAIAPREPRMATVAAEQSTAA